ncbi:MAG: helix-turn-helix domain-containing protein [Pleurocapsa sp.]
MKNRLKELRQLYKWSQAELARKLEISRQAVNGFESGKFDPSLEMAFKIATLLDVAIEDIFIYEAQNSMQTLVKQVKDFWGLEFGFERFDQKAIATISFARNLAAQNKCDRVEPQHLFAGLLADPTATSACLLKDSGVKQSIETNKGSFENSSKMKLSSQSKFVLELALQIVRLQDKKSIKTEHLLWGLVCLLDTQTSEIDNLFREYKVDIETLKDRLAETV